MPAPLSIDLRERIVEAYLLREQTHEEIAERFRVSVPTVERLGRRAREGRDLEPDRPTGRPRLLQEQHLAWLRKEMEADPYVTSHELTARFKRRFPRCRLHRSTVLRAMHELGFTFKKNSLRTPA